MGAWGGGEGWTVKPLRPDCGVVCKINQKCTAHEAIGQSDRQPGEQCISQPRVGWALPLGRNPTVEMMVVVVVVVTTMGDGDSNVREFQ